jgi:RimJ/RimL family protein N-acetyltransferase
MVDEPDEPDIELRTERLVLRRFGPDDLPSFVGYRSDPDVARYQSWDAGYSADDAARFLEADMAIVTLTPDSWVQLAAVDVASGALVGDCAVHMRGDQPDTYEIGVTFSPAAQGRGLASEAVTAVVRWLFAEQGAHRVIGECDARNQAVQRLFERMGFRLEARLVDADWFDGEWTTVLIYALLDGDLA